MRKNDKNEIISYENSIMKSNRFSVAKLNQSLTLRQMQLFSYAIYCTQQKSIDFRLVDFQKYFGLDTYHYKDGKTDAEKLMKLQFSEASEEDNYYDFLNIFQRMTQKKGLFTVKWADDILPHIMELRDHYVLTDLTITSKFKSSFSWLLYDYLKAHYNCWYKTVSKEALLQFFNVENNKSYQRSIAHFKARVLDVAIKEVNQYTEFEVSYEEVKKGRKTVAFDLKWSKGSVTVAASEKMIQQIERYIETIKEDSIHYTDVDDVDALKRIFAISREAIAMSEYVVYPPVIDKQKADVLLIKLKALLKELHHLTNRDSSSPEFYNWLDERE